MLISGGVLLAFLGVSANLFALFYAIGNRDAEAKAMINAFFTKAGLVSVVYLACFAGFMFLVAGILAGLNVSYRDPIGTAIFSLGFSLWFAWLSVLAANINKLEVLMIPVALSGMIGFAFTQTPIVLTGLLVFMVNVVLPMVVCRTLPGALCTTKGVAIAKEQEEKSKTIKELMMP